MNQSRACENIFPYAFTLFYFQGPVRTYFFGDAKTKGLSSASHFEKYRSRNSDV
jgi:hypothetical protein